MILDDCDDLLMECFRDVLGMRSGAKAEFKIVITIIIIIIIFIALADKSEQS